jgi:hypothetical protein
MTELFQIRHRVIANRFVEFFIPPLYCYSVGIPETLLLTPHSFHVSDHFPIGFIQPMLLLTLLFITNRIVVVLFPISIFAYFPQGLFYDLLIRAFNQLLLINCCFLTRDWNFVSRILLSVFLCFNPCRTIQINCFQLIFNLPTAFGRIRLILIPIVFRHVWANRSKPTNFVLLQFRWIFYPHPVLLQFRNSWDIIANTSFVSHPQLPEFGLTLRMKIIMLYF